MITLSIDPEKPCAECIFLANIGEKKIDELARMLIIHEHARVFHTCIEFYRKDKTCFLCEDYDKHKNEKRSPEMHRALERMHKEHRERHHVIEPATAWP